LPKDFELNVPILEYHLVDTRKDGIAQSSHKDAMASLVVSPETFKAQVKLLHDNGWKTITMAELAYKWVNRITVPDKTVVFTFDDGYNDGYYIAWPILKDAGYNATFYDIANRSIGSTDYPPTNGYLPPYLTASQLKELTIAGNDIGNHSFEHDESKTTTSAAANKQVYDASKYFASVTGIWPSTMAYPFGSSVYRICI
jgi:peptidoglycan/xylan/chitin deacetylase (PgdA/CDA1 family)